MSAGRAITCPSCGGSIAIKAAGHSVTLGCQYCGALLDVAHPDVAIIAKYRTALQGLTLPLGTRGTLFGTEWEAIGALARNDGDAYWTEFLLFNPYAGYRWLVQSEDDWQFGTMLLDRPVVDGESAVWRGSRYTIDYDPVSTTTDRVVGEFYWRVQAGDLVTASTYSSGNDMLSAEWTDGEINWTQLVSLSAGNIHAAFGLSPPASFDAWGDGTDDDDGGGAGGLGFLGRAQRMGGPDVMAMVLMGIVTLIASLFVMVGFGVATQSVENTVNVAVDGAEQSLKIGTLTIDRSYQPVTINARSGSFDNRWIDLDYMLVDRATQRAHTAYGVVERYSGTDSDGPWTEGSYSATVKFSAIPRGTYDVVVDAQAHAWPAPLTNPANQPPGTEPGPWDIKQPGSWDSGERIEVHFQADAGGVLWGNLWLEMALLFGLPAIILWWRAD
ncbi:DUF4178 domain-containing protein [Sphingopyxis sp.]|uniref:DUF4178 domain-containing protein n=1 Tax=Sphingopyxis sp. TaxID=1908224 RepID=UPI0035B1B352